MAEFTYGSGDPLMQLYGDPQFQNITVTGSPNESVTATGGAGLAGLTRRTGPVTDDQIQDALQQILGVQQAHTSSLSYRRQQLEPTATPALKGQYASADTRDQTWIDNYTTVLRALSGDPAAATDAHRILAEDIANHQTALMGGHETPAHANYYSILFNNVNDIITQRAPGIAPFTVPPSLPPSTTPSPETPVGTSVWNTPSSSQPKPTQASTAPTAMVPSATVFPRGLSASVSTEPPPDLAARLLTMGIDPVTVQQMVASWQPTATVTGAAGSAGAAGLPSQAR